MTMHPDAMDRIMPDAPWEAARARYAELATDDRPGDPYEVPLDPQDEPRPMVWAIVAVLLIGVAFVASIH